MSLWFVKKGCWEVGKGAIALRRVRGCDRFWEVGGSAIAVWGVEGVRSLFGKLEGCDRCLGG
ncbi:MAG: hypothetical protein HEQ13_17975 [Dolichospermum sp. DEX189]|uniref:Uncharacterized protein n=1 Tax=Aphanizomenon flos-aquae FACHB-1040 TaxID=2692887 RepID=A0ABR8BYB8_APHFL|nr:hypothetical protein [Aphanizomenon flos-aquae]MBD2279913.1 hypothetical protein [Aphanizomenon flos-aquae FACHB-1040]MBO1071130.1 hypothetical protein [Dolichospermum sp. DEX189]